MTKFDIGEKKIEEVFNNNSITFHIPDFQREFQWYSDLDSSIPPPEDSIDEEEDGKLKNCPYCKDPKYIPTT